MTAGRARYCAGQLDIQQSFNLLGSSPILPWSWQNAAGSVPETRAALPRLSHRTVLRLSSARNTASLWFVRHADSGPFTPSYHPAALYR